MSIRFSSLLQRAPSKDGTARIWNTQTGSELFTIKGRLGALLAVSFSPDGSRVLTASQDGTARIWNATTGSELISLKSHFNVVQAASFSPDGSRVVTASNDHTARIWDAETGHLLMAFADHQGDVVTAAFSPDGTQILTAGGDSVYVYSTKLDHYVKRACELLRGHRDVFHDVADVCEHVGVLPLPPDPSRIPMSQVTQSGGAG